MSGVVFGEATTDDRDQIIAISTITLQEHRDRQPDEFPLTAPDRTITAFDAYFAGSRTKKGRPPDRLIVARKDGLVMGYTLIQFGWKAVDDRTADLNCHVTDISVHPDYRGQGLGTQLLCMVRDICAKQKATVIGGYVWHGNTASAEMFAKADFQPVTTLYKQRLSPPRASSHATSAPDPRPKGKIDYLPILFVVVLLLLLARYSS